MNFLRRRLFVAYGLLLVLLGLWPGGAVGERIFPPRSVRRADDATLKRAGDVTLKQGVTSPDCAYVAYV